VRIAVISGAEEAELVALSARNSLDLENLRCALVDIGGGSLEIVITAGELIEEIFSLDLGAVVLAEQFLPRDPVPPKDLKALCKQVRSALKKHLAGESFDVQCLIGSGGTMTTIAGMVMAMRREQYSSVHGYDVLRSEVVHLIRHANLFGFSPREKEITANLARYHRKKLPRKKHENLLLLPPGDQRLVKQLAGILRLADGLDRRRNQAVQTLECHLTRSGLRITLYGQEDLSVEIYGGETKGDLFEEAFGCKLSLVSGAPVPG
jgi:exopolyphosphatase/pppGpp-phosphohydrolase